MEVDTPDAPSGFKEHFNGAVPIKRARMDLAKVPGDAQLRRRKEAEKAYGRGRKIPRMYAIVGVVLDTDLLQ